MVVRLLSTILLLAQTVSAYPNGAGSCVAGQAAIGGSHLEATWDGSARTFGVLSGSLAEGEVQVSLGGIPLDPTPPEGTFTAGEDYTISVVGILYDGYKGLLIRMESEGGELDLTGALQPGENTKVADICKFPVVGITHEDNTFKKESTGTIRLDQAGEVVLDITMVGINDDFASVYGYTRFTVSFEEEEGVISDSTSSQSLDAPSMMPSDAPSDDAVGRPQYDAVGRPQYDAVGRPKYDAVGRPKYDAVGRPKYDGGCRRTCPRWRHKQ